VFIRTLIVLRTGFCAGVLCLGATWAYAQPPVDVVYEGEYIEDIPVDEAMPLPEYEVYEDDYFEEPPVQQQAPVAPQRIVPQPLPPAPRVTPPARPTQPRAPRPRPAPPAATSPLVPSADAAAQAAQSGDTPAGDLDAAKATGGKFDFQEAPLYTVIESISRATGRNFDVDPNIGSVLVTVITHDEIPPELAYEVLESILESRGYSLVETLDGHLIKVIPTPNAVASAKVPLRRGTDDDVGGYDAFATHVIQVEYSDPTELSGALRILGSPNARIDTYLPTNTLIITDTSEGLRRMFDFLRLTDLPGNETVMEIFTLEYTRAEILMGQLEQVLMDESGGRPGAAMQQVAGQPQQPARPQPTRVTRPVRPTIPGAAGDQIIGSRNETLRMVPDERLNSLIVLATAGMMERVRDLVRRLDTPTPYEANTVHLYELLNADAEAVESALQPLLGMSPRRAGGGGGGGAAAGGGGGGGAGVAGDVQPFERQVQISRYDQTNALLVVASPQDYKILEALIARLDVPQRQVHVDAVVMDVTTSNDYGVSVDAAKVTGNDGFGLGSTANINALAAALRPVGDAANQILTPGAALAGAVLGLGTEGGITAGVFDDIEVNVGGRMVKVPFVPLLFQAIETVSDIEVLSQPSLVTVDNEEARIIVGQEVPFVVSQGRTAFDSDGNPTSLGFGGGFNQIQRQDVGVELMVTPQISEGDNVLLDIEIEISDTDATQIGTVDLLGPTTNKTRIQNKVLVKDGSTAMLAGLIRDNATRDRRQAPVLGDVPVLGIFFRSRSHRREKRNLVVLVTPSIIKSNVDMKRVTQYKVEEYHDTNIDHLMSGGFFKKVKKKADDRRDHRPTYDRSEALTGRSTSRGPGFRRGDIER